MGAALAFALGPPPRVTFMVIRPPVPRHVWAATADQSGWLGAIHWKPAPGPPSVPADPAVRPGTARPRAASPTSHGRPCAPRCGPARSGAARWSARCPAARRPPRSSSVGVGAVDVLRRVEGCQRLDQLGVRGAHPAGGLDAVPEGCARDQAAVEDLGEPASKRARSTRSAVTAQAPAAGRSTTRP